MEDPSYTEIFWSVICRSRTMWVGMFAFCILFLLVLLVMLPFQPPGTAAYVISIVTVVALGFVALQLGFILWKCGKWEDRDYDA